MTIKNEQAQGASDHGSDMAGQVSQTKSAVAQYEEKILEFWQKNQIFEKSLELHKPENDPRSKGELVFYDGPPFATGLPHYGHILPRTIKDLIPRYKTMRGYYVPRVWGWDCHGLPIENLIQKENNLKNKKDIEEFGIKAFSQAAKNSVFRYDAEWKKYVPRSGRWVDMENHYTTMDATFMESVWWAFKELDKKGLVYESFKSVHISPALETALSNFEVGQNYKDITDLSAYVSFKLEKSADNSDDNTYLIAWTTTPWTLPGNVALAVGEEMNYVNFEILEHENFSGKNFILAKNRLQHVLEISKINQSQIKIVEEFKGKALVGKKYQPLFDYYAQDHNLENHQNGWQVYGADFVTEEDGAGIVHIAPAFGEDDLNLAKKNNLPFIQHVNIDGTIKKEATDFAGRQAKPKATDQNPNAHQETDIEVVKYLAHHGNLFAKEKFTHSYPHCWRTDVPLLNYAMSSWFIKVTDYNQKMVELNKSVNWIPKAVGEKRFGNWLENVRDWGISRARYWGTPIPVWQNEDGQTEILGSVADIKNRTKRNNYFIMRHGQAEHNVAHYLAGDNTVKANLTEQGREEAKALAKRIKEISSEYKVDYLYTSPLKRCLETAEIIAQEIGLDKSQIIVEDNFKEVQSGILNGKPTAEYLKLVNSIEEQFFKAPENGETLIDIKKRVGPLLKEIDQKHQNKNIFILSHEYPLWMISAVSEGWTNKQITSSKKFTEPFIKTGEVRKLDYAQIPWDDEYVLDLHRPYIDEITYQKDGKNFKRIPDVFDTWFDSGSMPFAVPHYPFEKKKSEIKESFLGKLFGAVKNNNQKGFGFPADFIAESLDQTRGWFYTLLALNTALFGKAPYKNVVVSGLILAEDGRKMSKSLKNYPDLNIVLDKYGADALRYYLMTSPAVRADSVNFSEKGVDEVTKKINNRLLNIISFVEMYGENSSEKAKAGDKDFSVNDIEKYHALDQWIVARLNELGREITDSLESYEVDKAYRPVLNFVDDFSTWYIRRSRERFKSDDEQDKSMALKTTLYVLENLAKLLAPCMPFLAEHLWQFVANQSSLKNYNLSVHLETWPEFKEQNKKEEEILKQMRETRFIVALGLEARDKAGLRVRQPLALPKTGVNTGSLGGQIIELIADEVNVREVAYDANLKHNDVWLDTEITEELFNQGLAREIIRFVQSLRKKAEMQPDQVINLQIEVNAEAKSKLENYLSEIKSAVNASSIDFKSENDLSNAEELKFENYTFKIKLI